MKKRGFGEGRWNGFGGKVKHDEHLHDAAVRECQEECCIFPKNIQEFGTLYFHFLDESPDIEMHIFLSDTYEGEPKETDEMRPQWYHFSDLPYDEMWLDDRHWLPHVLDGKKVYGNFYFSDPLTLNCFDLCTE